MKIFINFFNLSLLTAALTFAQVSKPLIETTKLSENLYQIFIYLNSSNSVNIYALNGSEGLLLIDAGFSSTADLVKEELIKISGNKIKYIINTHSDGDHTGGNAALADDANIIAHKNCRETLLRNPRFPPAGLPQLTVSDSMRIYLNDEEIILKYMPGHTATDLVIYFKNANIAFVGDLIFADSFPLIHPYGNIYQYEKTLSALSKTFNSKTRIFSGHGRELINADIPEYQKMFSDTKNIVLENIKKNRLPDELKDKNVLKSWEKWNSKIFPNDLNTSMWIDNLYSALDEGKELSAYNVLQKMYDEKGISEMLSVYRKANLPGGKKLFFIENDINNWGYTLLGEQKYSEAIEIFKINSEIFPASANAFDSLAEAYMTSGNKELAIKYYEKSLELNSQNTNAVEQLKKLKFE